MVENNKCTYKNKVSVHPILPPSGRTQEAPCSNSRATARARPGARARRKARPPTAASSSPFPLRESRGTPERKRQPANFGATARQKRLRISTGPEEGRN